MAQVALEKMMVEDGSALRKISEAADRSYQVAPEPSQLLLRIKSFAIDFAVFLAELSPTKDHFNSQWCSRKIGIESSHFINTTWKHFSVVRMNLGCNVSALRRQLTTRADIVVNLNTTIRLALFWRT